MPADGRVDRVVETRGETERMNDLEALMWAVQTDPHLSSAFANLTLLDRPPDLDRLWARMWRASRVVPRLRRRVIEGSGPSNPRWVDDPDFDLTNHLSHVTLPSGSTDLDAYQLAADLSSAPLDRAHPLWHFTVVEGLPHGRAAMVQQMHHTITDGEGGIRMSVEYIDLSRDAPAPEPVDDGPPPRPRHLPQPDDEPGEPREPTVGFAAPLGSATEALQGLLRRGADTAGNLVGAATRASRDPAHLGTNLIGLPGEAVATVRSVGRQLAVMDRRRSPLWTDRSLERTMRTFSVSLDDVRTVADRLDGTVNDVFVTAAAGGAGAYHRDRGVEVSELRMAMPVSTRSRGGDQAEGNSFTPTRVLVPTDPDPRARFGEIHRRLQVTKTEPVNDRTAALAGLATMIPRSVLARTARQQVASVDFTTSNVRAAPFDLYIAGALMEANYPLGPLVGTAWNLTTMSYRGSLYLGLLVDPVAVDDPDALAAAIEAAFGELIALT